MRGLFCLGDPMATMTTLADAVKSAIEDTQSIYNGAPWTTKREEYEAYWNIYSGAEWDETTGVQDPDTGRAQLRYPLQVRPAAKCCRIHRAVMFGMREDTSLLPVRAAVASEGPGAREAQLRFQNFINSSWVWSQGAAVMEEAGLLLQIYGGHFFKVAWEFWNGELPHRIAVRSLKSPAWCMPIYDIYDPWHLMEAWIGYRIPAEVALVKYGVRSDKKEVLYLEHWTRDEWRITVGGEVPKMKWGDRLEAGLEGENPWGLVPVVYIPHEREGDFYGRSLVANLPGLARELNARLADTGDAVRETAHRFLVMRNTRSRGALMARRIVAEGRYVGEAVDIGDAPPITGSKDPDLFAVESHGVPSSVAGFPDTLWEEIRRQADVAAVAMGDDDVSGGRITGPVTSYRMFPSISHTMTERANFSTGLNMIAQIMATIVEERERSGTYRQLGIEGPGITPEMRQMTLRQAWYPMIPIEQIQKVQMLTLRLQAGGISLETYLDKMGEDDIPQEIERIHADMEWEMRTEAAIKAGMAKPKKKGVASNPGNFDRQEE